MLMGADEKTMVKRILWDVFIVLWPPVILRLGYFLLVTVIFDHPDRALLLTDGFFLAHFLFIGLIVFCIFLTFRQSYRGKRLLLLLFPLLMLFCLSLPSGCWDTFPILARFFAWRIWYNETLHHLLFFTYFLCLIKGVAETVKDKENKENKEKS